MCKHQAHKSDERVMREVIFGLYECLQKELQSKMDEVLYLLAGTKLQILTLRTHIQVVEEESLEDLGVSLSIYLLYWYKSTNTDAAHAHPGGGGGVPRGSGRVTGC